MPSMNMKMPRMKMIVCRLAPRLAVALVALAVAACALDKQDAPALSGPSEFGLAIVMVASPDQLPRDGFSRSVITLTTRDAQGAPVAGQRIALSLGTNAPQGASLSTTEVTTGSGGQATFFVTAPNPNSLGDISIRATPVGGDSANATARVITIEALPRNSAGPAFAPIAFTVSPPAPEVGELVTFDASCHPSNCSASGVTDEGAPCNACIFSWSFGSGEGTATGQIVRHAFSAGGTFPVRLIVTDAGGITALAEQNVAVSAIGPPTASFVSPAAMAGQSAIFDASASRATANHRIVTYAWVWGDGSTNNQTSSPTIQHTYNNARTYSVTLTVTDDLGQSATVTHAVVVDNGLTAVLSRSPQGTVILDQTVTFDGSQSSSSTGTQITNYLFDFGDGTSQSSSFNTAKHEYIVTGTFTVKLTITDEKGQTAFTTMSVPVTNAP